MTSKGSSQFQRGLSWISAVSPLILSLILLNYGLIYILWLNDTHQYSILNNTQQYFISQTSYLLIMCVLGYFQTRNSFAERILNPSVCERPFMEDVERVRGDRIMERSNNYCSSHCPSSCSRGTRWHWICSPHLSPPPLQSTTPSSSLLWCSGRGRGRQWSCQSDPWFVNISQLFTSTYTICYLYS